MHPVHSRFSRAANFLAGELILALVEPSIGAGPLNVVLDALPEAGDAPLELGPLGLRLGSFRAPLPPETRFDSGLAWKPPDLGRLKESLARLRDLLLQHGGPLSLAFLMDLDRRPTAGFQGAYAARMEAGAEALLGDDPAGGAALLKGSGVGLTPGGDDFLAGHLFALHLLGEPARVEVVAAAARTANPFSRTFLELAHRGRPFERLQRLILGLHGEAPLEPAARSLLAVGETSGADLAVGLCLTLLRRVSAPAPGPPSPP